MLDRLRDWYDYPVMLRRGDYRLLQLGLFVFWLLTMLNGIVYFATR